MLPYSRQRYGECQLGSYGSFSGLDAEWISGLCWDAWRQGIFSDCGRLVGHLSIFSLVVSKLKRNKLMASLGAIVALASCYLMRGAMSRLLDTKLFCIELGTHNVTTHFNEYRNHLQQQRVLMTNFYVYVILINFKKIGCNINHRIFIKK